MPDIYVLQLAHPNATLESVGGKGLSRAKMRYAGLPVPDGFHVTTAAYQRFVADNGLQPQILAALQALDANNPAALEAAARQIGKSFSRGQIPAEIAAAVSTAYAAMQGIPVAVRSSATAEDLPEASFAGQQETYLNVRGEQAVLEAIQKCWASLWTARAIAYRIKNQVDQGLVALAVVVQELVFADAAGILFTANPITGKRNEVVINAAWGLGEAIVSGAVTPDTVTVQKDTGRILHWETAEKAVMTVQSEHGIHQAPVPEAQKKQAVLTKAQAAELARLGAKIEAFYGMPMDIEWTLRRDVFAIVQARPITALPPEWNRPHPEALYTRGSLAEHLPNPVTPLFGTLGLRAVNKATAELGDLMRIDALAVEYQYRSINGYVFMGVLLKGKALWNMGIGALTSLKFMLSQSTQRWQTSRQDREISALGRAKPRNAKAL
jgi:pyruvate,water dikinase